MRKSIILIIALLLAIMPMCTVFADELILEEGFDSDNNEWYAEMWDSSGLAEIVDVDGSSAVHIYSSVENDVRYCRDVEVSSDTVYKMTCRIKTRDISGGNGANIAIVGSYAFSDTLLGTNDWTDIVFVGKTGASQDKLTVCLRLGGYGATSMGEAWFDGFTFAKLDDATGLNVADFSEFETPSGDSTNGDSNNEPIMGNNDAATVHPTPEEAHGLFNLFLVFALVLFVIGFACYWFFVRGSSKRKVGAMLDDKCSPLPIILILLGALIVRIILASQMLGYHYDVNCFTYWGARAASVPLSQFYETWCDYPPGYIYVLGAMSGLADGMGLISGSNAHMFVIKLPAILCDIGAAFITYKFAKSRLPKAATYTITSFVAFSPVMAFVSGGWAQIDSVLTMLLFAAAFLLCEKKVVWAGLVYGIAIAVKPQAFMVGPVFALVYLMYIIDAVDGKARIRTLLKTLVAVASAVGVIVLVSIPFWPIASGEPLFEYIPRLFKAIFDKYFSTLGGYDYATIEAYNLFGLAGANWRPSGDMFVLGMTYKQFGTLMMGLSILAAWVLYIFGRKKNKYCVLLIMAFLLSALFMFGHYMHERYLSPVLLLIAIAFCVYRDRRLFIAFIAFSAGLLINILGAYTIILPVVDGNALRAGLGSNYNTLVKAGAVVNLLSFAFFAYTCASLTIKGKILGQKNADEVAGK